VDFFDVKGDLEALAAPRGLATESAEHPLLHPGRSARVLVEGSDVGWLGELHPRIVKEFELPRAPIAFELRLDALVAAVFLRERRSRACRSCAATWQSWWMNPCPLKPFSPRSRR
jgi:phenylalanyl-tRNA synthetase beta subunit